jgi:hypothetical protein
MYYFYLNFPNYKKNSIMIHYQDCGDCKSGHGKLGSLSNKNGFWAGPFNSIRDTEDALNKLMNLVEYKFTFKTCSRCIKP